MVAISPWQFEGAGAGPNATVVLLKTVGERVTGIALGVPLADGTGAGAFLRDGIGVCVFLVDGGPTTVVFLKSVDERAGGSPLGTFLVD